MSVISILSEGKTRQLKRLTGGFYCQGDARRARGGVNMKQEKPLDASVYQLRLSETRLDSLRFIFPPPEEQTRPRFTPWSLQKKNSLRRGWMPASCLFLFSRRHPTTSTCIFLDRRLIIVILTTRNVSRIPTSPTQAREGRKVSADGEA